VRPLLETVEPIEFFIYTVTAGNGMETESPMSCVIARQSLPDAMQCSQRAWWVYRTSMRPALERLLPLQCFISTVSQSLWSLYSASNMLMIAESMMHFTGIL